MLDQNRGRCHSTISFLQRYETKVIEICTRLCSPLRHNAHSTLLSDIESDNRHPQCKACFRHKEKLFVGLYNMSGWKFWRTMWGFWNSTRSSSNLDDTIGRASFHMLWARCPVCNIVRGRNTIFRSSTNILTIREVACSAAHIHSTNCKWSEIPADLCSPYDRQLD